MIGYVTVGTNDLDKARDFYLSLLGTIGAKELMRFESGATIIGPSFEQPSVCVMMAFDGKAASVGNGMMVAFAAGSIGVSNLVGPRPKRRLGRIQGWIR